MAESFVGMYTVVFLIFYSILFNNLKVNPAVVNEHFETTPSGIALSGEETTEPELYNPDVLPDLTQPHSEISYDLRELPPLSLNSTQVNFLLF